MEEKSSQYQRAEKIMAAILFIVFCLWCPVYLLLVRPIINNAIAPYISAYPAALHLIPILAPVVLIALAAKPFLPPKIVTNSSNISSQGEVNDN